MAGTLQLDFLQASSNTGLYILSPTGSTIASVNTAGFYSATGNQMFNATGIISSGSDITVNGLTVGKGGASVLTNTAVGASALAATATGGKNTTVGYLSLTALTSGERNCSFGNEALKTLTTGTGSVAIGDYALYTNNGNFNIAVGTYSMYYNTSGTNNVAIGPQALQSNTTASNNTAVGYQAGYSNTTGAYNLFMGYITGQSNTTGTQNTFVGGLGAGNAVTTGGKNTIIGNYSGNNGGLDIRTASNYVVLSDGDGNPRAWIGAGNNNDLFRVGTTSTSTSSWMHQISYNQTSRAIIGFTNDVAGGNPNGINISYPNSGDTSSTNTYLYCSNNAGARAYIKNDGGINNYSGNNSNLSDRREKKDFEPSKSYLETICAIPVQTFNYIDQSDDIKTLGVVAQDVQEVAPELVHESNWGTEENPRIRLSIYQTDLQYALMKSIQELKAIVDTQSAQIAAQAEEIAALKAK